MSTGPLQGRVPELLLERLAAGELPAELREEILRRLDEESGGRERLDELEASNRAILAVLPPARVVPEIERRLGRRRGRARFLSLAGLAATAAAVLLVFLLAPRLLAPPDEGLRPKGDPRLTIYRKGAAGVEELRAGATVQEGDLLQIRYASAGREHGVIFSVDGRGEATLHFPRTASESTALEGTRLLPYAYELDAAPGFERFFFVTSHATLDPEAILRLGRTLGPDPRAPLRLPPGTLVVEHLLLKPSLKVPR